MLGVKSTGMSYELLASLLEKGCKYGSSKLALLFYVSVVSQLTRLNCAAFSSVVGMPITLCLRDRPLCSICLFLVELWCYIDETLATDWQSLDIDTLNRSEHELLLWRRPSPLSRVLTEFFSKSSDSPSMRKQDSVMTGSGLTFDDLSTPLTFWNTLLLTCWPTVLLLIGFGKPTVDGISIMSCSSGRR